MENVFREDKSSNIEIRRCKAIANFMFLKLKITKKTIKLPWRQREDFLNSYVISIALYGRKCWTISLQMKWRQEVIEIWFYRRIMRIQLIDPTYYNEVLWKMETMLIPRNKKVNISRKQWKMKVEKFATHRITLKQGKQWLRLVDAIIFRKCETDTNIHVRPHLTWPDPC